MADYKKPAEEVSAKEAEEAFANAAKAFGNFGRRSGGFQRVAIPAEDPTPEETPAPVAEATQVITPVTASAVVEEVEEHSEDLPEEYEPTADEVNEYIAFSALEDALNRHKDVYGTGEKQGRGRRYHDYGFGRGISFDGPSYWEDDEDSI